MRIRPVRPDDVAALHQARIQPRSLRGTLGLPSIVESQMAGLTDPDPQAIHVLVAEVDGQAVGTISVHLFPSVRTRHGGAVGMMIHDAYQGRGIGTALMEAALDLTDNWLMLERVELDVFPDNEPAVKLYRKSGFVEEGLVRQGALRDGKPVDLLPMARLRGRALTAAPQDLAPDAAPRGPELAVTVRPVKPSDAEALYAILTQPAVLRQLDLPPSFTVAQMRKRLNSLGSSDHLMVAEAEGQVVGCGQLQVYGGRRVCTGAIPLLAVDQRFAGRGAGASLLSALIDLGENWLGLRRIALETVADNHAALRLAARHGFAQEVRKRAALARQGHLVDTVLLARLKSAES